MSASYTLHWSGAAQRHAQTVRSTHYYDIVMSKRQLSHKVRSGTIENIYHLHVVLFKKYRNIFNIYILLLTISPNVPLLTMAYTLQSDIWETRSHWTILYRVSATFLFFSILQSFSYFYCLPHYTTALINVSPTNCCEGRGEEGGV